MNNILSDSTTTKYRPLLRNTDGSSKPLPPGHGIRKRCPTCYFGWWDRYDKNECPKCFKTLVKTARQPIRQCDIHGARVVFQDQWKKADPRRRIENPAYEHSTQWVVSVHHQHAVKKLKELDNPPKPPKTISAEASRLSRFSNKTAHAAEMSRQRRVKGVEFEVDGEEEDTSLEQSRSTSRKGSRSTSRTASRGNTPASGKRDVLKDYDPLNAKRLELSGVFRDTRAY